MYSRNLFVLDFAKNRPQKQVQERPVSYTHLTGGFEMGNLWYNEPKTLDVAFDVIGDIVLSAASQQYGGFTVPSVENILAPYAEK